MSADRWLLQNVPSPVIVWKISLKKMVYAGYIGEFVQTLESISSIPVWITRLKIHHSGQFESSIAVSNNGLSPWRTDIWNVVAVARNGFSNGSFKFSRNLKHPGVTQKVGGIFEDWKIAEKILTFSLHAHIETLHISTVLTSVSLSFIDHTVAVISTCVCQVFPYCTLKKALAAFTTEKRSKINDWNK